MNGLLVQMPAQPGLTRVSPQAAGLSMPGEPACAALSGVPPWVLGAQGALLPATNQGRWGLWPLGCLHKQVQDEDMKGYERVGHHQQPSVPHCPKHQASGIKAPALVVPVSLPLYLLSA
jgi:hypothetical protein